jgi:hypothetical protein
MLTVLTLLTMGMVTTLAAVLSREEEPGRVPVRRAQSGVRIRVRK